MAAKTYILKNDGNKNISKSFKVREFACRDGSEKILIDGSFGPQTKLAVKDFQTKMSLTSDGICSSKTKGALKAEVI